MYTKVGKEEFEKVQNETRFVKLEMPSFLNLELKDLKFYGAQMGTAVFLISIYNNDVSTMAEIFPDCKIIECAEEGKEPKYTLQFAVEKPEAILLENMQESSRKASFISNPKSIMEMKLASIIKAGSDDGLIPKEPVASLDEIEEASKEEIPMNETQARLDILGTPEVKAESVSKEDGPFITTGRRLVPEQKAPEPTPTIIKKEEPKKPIYNNKPKYQNNQPKKKYIETKKPVPPKEEEYKPLSDDDLFSVF